jgi:tyrosinase
MNKLTRRTTLAMGAAALARPALSQAKLLRSDIRMPSGQANLAKYATAVDIMMGLPASDAKSWTFQWYIHSVPDGRKVAELKRIYPNPSAARKLAEETWSTCRAHSNGDDPDHFLPWHRMYLGFFEATVRTILKDPTFSLPYWNYTDPTNRALPDAFRKKGDSKWGSLYRPNRNNGVNAGHVIDEGLSPSPLTSEALTEATYRPSGPKVGFCQNLDGSLHGSVHVRVGNGVGMGSIPWAANDPIFWLHHCNIDRMWASWNHNGGRNPSDPWTAQTFVFPNGKGGKATPAIGSVLDMAALPYTYDSFEPGPTIAAGAAAGPPRAANPVAQASGVSLGADGAEVSLKAVPGRKPGPAGAAGKRLYLRISQLSAKTQPGVLYDVELRDPSGAWRHVGYVNFLDAVPHADHSGMAGMPPGGAPAKTFSFDVTDIASGISGAPSVRVRPAGAPASDASPLVGRLEIVEY